MPASASSSPAPPASWAPRWSSACCDRPRAASSCCSSARAACAPSSSAPSREIFKNDCFDRLREELGGKAPFDEMVARRVQVVAGDVGTDGLGPRRGRTGDPRRLRHRHPLRRHRVSFDAALDLAVEVNLLGPTRVAQTCHELGTSRPTSSPCRPATWPATGGGAAPEAPVDASPFWLDDLNWKSEVDRGPPRPRRRRRREPQHPHARAASATRPAASSAAAGTAAARRQDRALRRRDWVKDRWSRPAAPAPCPSAGPTPTPTPRPSASRPCAQSRGDVPVSDRAPVDHRVGPGRARARLDPRLPHGGAGHHLLRPWPAEGVPRRPRGHRRRHPRRPRGRRASSRSPRKGPSPTCRTRRSTRSPRAARNPLEYQRLVNLVQGWFSERPLYDTNGQPIVVPEWSFPGRGRVQTQLERAKLVLGTAESVLERAPLRRQAGRVVDQVEEKQELADRALIYVELYGAYTECEAIYGVERLLDAVGRGHRRGPGRLRRRPRASSTGTATSTEIHLPSIVEHARVNTSGSGSAPATPRFERLRKQVLSPDRQFAAFDLENTLISSNVVDVLRLARHPAPARRRASSASPPSCIAEGPALLALDRRDRADFLRSFYRRYEDAPADQLALDSVELFNQLLLAKCLPRGHPPGPRAPRARPPHGAHHRRARLRRRAAPAAVRRHRLHPHVHRHRRGRRGPLHRPARPTCRPPARAGRRPCSTTPRPHGFQVSRGGGLRRLVERPSDARGRRASPWP